MDTMTTHGDYIRSMRIGTVELISTNAKTGETVTRHVTMIQEPDGRGLLYADPADHRDANAVTLAPSLVPAFAALFGLD
jgi:hypothetical protein